jgi:hypothetical protein
MKNNTNNLKEKTMKNEKMKTNKNVVKSGETIETVGKGVHIDCVFDGGVIIENF